MFTQLGWVTHVIGCSLKGRDLSGPSLQYRRSLAVVRAGSTFSDTPKMKLVIYEVSSLVCDPGMNHRHALSMVASSRAIHIPITLPKGSVVRNEASWCGVTKMHKPLKVDLLGKESHFEFCCLQQALFCFTFTSNPWLLEGERTRTFWVLLLLLGLCDVFQRQIWWLYLKNVHTLQHNRTCKPQGLCDALNPAPPKKNKTKQTSSACEWVQIVPWFHSQRSTAHLNSGWMCNLFVQRLIRMQSWEDKTGMS